LSLFRQIYNALKSDAYAKALKPSKEGVGEPPRITFKKQIEAYFKDAAARDFVDVLAMQAVGMGFYTTCASQEKYPKAEDAKNIVDAFNEDNDIDDLLQDTGRELVATGNSLWQLLTPGSVKNVLHIPIVSFERVFTNEFLKFTETEFTRKQKIQLGFKQTAEYGGNIVPPDSVWFFRLNTLDGSGWGSGVMRVLLEEYSWQEYDKNTGQYSTRTRPSLLEIKAKLDLDLIEIFEKFAGPLEAYVTEDKKLAEKIEAELKTMPKYGGRLVASGKGGLDIKTPPLEPRARFGESIEYLWNQFCLGGLTPLPKLFTTPGFTEASAKAAIDIADRLILPTQRLIKRRVEALWRKVIVAADSSLDPVKASVRLNFGAPESPEVIAADLIHAAELDLIRSEEFRKNAVKFGWELWEAQQSNASQEAKK
jgi:hypothetical protein